MQNSTTSNITMSHTKQHREETFPFDGGLGIASGVGGIIPAHAGLTAYSISFAHCARDHSRVCGAHSASMAQRTTRSGSSPRMRGSLHEARRNRLTSGIIPAYAGLTRPLVGAPNGRRDHPRACGAHSSFPSRQSDCQGSSPRMRGSLLLRAALDEEAGIIPAHAGLTCGAALLPLPRGDHPRACGAHQTLDLKLTDSQGSSPRMRGSPWVVRPGRAADGIIPAHAGLTHAPYTSTISGRDHPRACGAHPALASSMGSRLGSSPRMRGSLLPATVAVFPEGIIPAHAGLTRFL